MALLVELSGEQLELACEEAVAAASVLSGEQTQVLERDGPALLLDAPDRVATALASRLGLAHRVCTQASSGPLIGAARLAGSVAIGDAASFRVRARRVQTGGTDVDHKAIEREAGALIAGRTGARVDLGRPEAEVRALLARRAFVGLLTATVDRSAMEARAVRHRPYSMPVSIHPKLARAMVNLARAPLGGTVLDPFAGTGGIMIEAALMGYSVSGADVDPRMVAGSRDNLASLGLTARMEPADVRELGDRDWGPVDAIVTDPPYGRSTHVRGGGPTEVLEGLFSGALQVLRSGARLVLCLPSEDMLPGEGSRLRVMSVHPVRVHRSLTRHICVVQR